MTPERESRKLFRRRKWSRTVRPPWSSPLFPAQLLRVYVVTIATPLVLWIVTRPLAVAE